MVNHIGPVLLRPEEPLIPTRLEMRINWFSPDHFDLAGVLWTAWPDLNYVRFRIYEGAHTELTSATDTSLY